MLVSKRQTFVSLSYIIEIQQISCINMYNYQKINAFFWNNVNLKIQGCMWGIILKKKNVGRDFWLEIVPVHDDVIKWKHFPRNWPFVRKIHRSPVNFPHKGQWRGALMFSLIYAWINDWVNKREAGDLRRLHGHYDVIVMSFRMANALVTSGISVISDSSRNN